MFLAAFDMVIVKYAVLGCAFPLWMPFAKALYAELNDALAAEGGLFGRTPTPQEVKFILKDTTRAKSPLVSYEYDPNQPGQGGARQSPAASQKNAPVAKGGGGAPRKTGNGGFAKPRGVRGFARKDQHGR